ncbi:FAD/NAD(P)-binding domain-containing protein [Hypoxylon sp. NC1633]|nr:FAD/NAD(P)-binding domain-containing protein [Hypoxylon sp. NC1633]
MNPDDFDVKVGEHITGKAVNAYLKSYAAHFGIGDLIRLEHKVIVVEHQDTSEGGWFLTAATPTGESKIFARRLIIATGLTSEAFLPHFEGQETFGGKLFHSKDFQKNSDTVKTAKAVTVFGATKSAWDAVYAYAVAGVKVNWIIRPSGHGPCWIAPTHVTPLKKWIEKLANTRLLTWFSPCIWGDADGYNIRNFYHGTVVGRAVVDTFWKILGSDVLTLNDYDAHPDTAKLKPWTEAMFTGASFSILNYDKDIFKLVRSDKVDVYVGEVDHLSPGKVHLSDGTEFESDVFLASTGWKHVPAFKILPEGIEKELGIPHQRTEGSATAEDLANNEELLKRADQEILQRFPRLKRQPVWNKAYVPLTDQKGISSKDEVTPYKPLTPYTLYHFLVPPSARFLRTRDVAFAGMISNFSTSTTAHLSGLWISAYFSGKLSIDPAAAIDDEASLKNLQYQTLLWNRWGKWRYPTDWGSKNPSIIFDAVPYFDLLQRDLGLSPYRKGGRLAEMSDPYGPEDYRTITEEWMAWHDAGKSGKAKV